MEESRELSLDEKVQKLINNYTRLKSKYADLVVEKAELEKKNSELSVKFDADNGRSEQLTEQLAHLQDENSLLKSELDKLQSRIKQLEHNNLEAASKIDNILGQIDEL